MNGRGKTARVRARRDRVLRILFDAPCPLTHGQVAHEAGEVRLSSSIYNDLRQLCGDRTIPYEEWSKYGGRFNAPGFPVIWNSWTSDTGMYVTWELTAEARAELAAAYDSTDLEAMFAAPAYER